MTNKDALEAEHTLSLYRAAEKSEKEKEEKEKKDWEDNPNRPRIELLRKLEAERKKDELYQREVKEAWERVEHPNFEFGQGNHK